MNENKPTGKRGQIPSQSPHPMREWRVVEDAVLTMSDTRGREQLVDVLVAYYAEAFATALEVSDARR